MPLHACHALHRRAFQLAADADQVAAEASEIAVSTDRCLENLEELSQHLKRSVLDGAREAALKEAALDQRQSNLLSELRLKSARTAAQTSDSPTREALHASQRAALMERIARAEIRRAAAENEAKAARLETMNRLAEMHRHELRQSAVSVVDWRSEFEALLCKQRAHADWLCAEVQDETTTKLAKSLASATAAVEASAPDARKYMQTLLSLVRALAESECRRRALLMKL